MLNSQPQAPTGQWPPEVPPFRPPVPPTEPARPVPRPQPSILPSWDEPDQRSWERDVTERLLEHRIVIVGGSLDDELADRAAAQLLLLGRSDERIEVHLTCPESELDAALALADAIDLLAAPVHATVRGTLGGPAVAVLCAAQRRTAHRNALFVLTVPPASGDGTAGQLGNLAEIHLRQVAALRARMSAVTGRSDADVAADLESGRLLSAEEALSYGLVHEVR